MTWSILARDEHGHFGVAIASRFFAVGALCVHSRRGVGALSTQALMNPLYGPAGIEAALDDDLNTPQALAELSRIAAEARKAEGADERARLHAELLGAGFALGLLQQDPAAWFARGSGDGDDARIQALVDERNAAKQSRDFARADAIRAQLAGEGVLLEDTAQGVRWRRA